MGRRLLALIASLAVVLAACGKAEPANPYGTLDRAITVSWQQVTLNLGFSIDVPAQQNGDFPVPATAIQVDPSAIQATIDTSTGRWHVTTSIPFAALGISPQQVGQMGLNVQSLDVELLFDGTALYAKSPLLPNLLQGVGGGLGAPIQGDLTGWLRLLTKEDLEKMEQLADVPGALSLFGFGGQVASIPWPSAGSPEALQALLQDFGITLVGAGRESSDGVESEHVQGTINLANLASSRTLATMTGFGRDQLQGIFDASKQITISADLWTNATTGRIGALRIDAHTLNAPNATVSIVLQFKEPAAGPTWDAPATFTDVPLLQLMGAPVNGVIGTVGEPVPILETIDPGQE